MTIHLHTEPWGLPACISPQDAYRAGRSQDLATLGDVARVRMTNTTSDADAVSCSKCQDFMADEVEVGLLGDEVVHWVDPEDSRILPCTGDRRSGARSSDNREVTCPGCIAVFPQWL